jgi:rare lipoprotein A
MGFLMRWQMFRIRTVITVFLSTIVLSACTSPSFSPSDGLPSNNDSRTKGSIPADAVPRAEGKSRYGNPESYVVFGKRYYVRNSSVGYEERGIASWYGKKFHGRKTSNGEVYDMYAMTAAHKSLPLPTYVQVTNLENGRQTILRVNDRGPFHGNRLIDLSYSAARKLGIIAKGTGLVNVRALQPGEQPTTTQTQLAKSTNSSVIQKVKIYLQAGAFSLRENAINLKTRLTSITQHNVLIQSARSKVGEVFRVRLGPLNSVADADQLSRKMLDLNMDLPRIIIE